MTDRLYAHTCMLNCSGKAVVDTPKSKTKSGLQFPVRIVIWAFVGSDHSLSKC